MRPATSPASICRSTAAWRKSEFVAAANRDERKFVDADVFNIHRERLPHLTFDYGFHNCLGNALAPVEGRIALEEVLKRFPDWEVDMSRARMSPTTMVRGWEALPAFL